VSVQGLLCAFVTVYLVVLFARAIFSWFPAPDGGLATLNRLLVDLTEPLLAPLRRIIPPAGMFDLSFIVAFLLLTVLRTAICAA
jgi:YggT family protein